MFRDKALSRPREVARGRWRFGVTCLHWMAAVVARCSSSRSPAAHLLFHQTRSLLWLVAATSASAWRRGDCAKCWRPTTGSGRCTEVGSEQCRLPHGGVCKPSVQLEPGSTRMHHFSCSCRFRRLILPTTAHADQVPPVYSTSPHWVNRRRTTRGLVPYIRRRSTRLQPETVVCDGRCCAGEPRCAWWRHHAHPATRGIPTAWRAQG